MDVNTVLKLVEAGFSKEEILSLSSPSATPVSPAETPAAPEAVKVEKKEEGPEVPAAVPPAAADPVDKALDAKLESIEKLFNKLVLMAGMPAIDNVQPKGIDDIVDSFFKGE